jgi:hypothetical protein
VPAEIVFDEGWLLVWGAKTGAAAGNGPLHRGDPQAFERAGAPRELSYLLSLFIFSFAAAHSFLLISRKPWPLQEFWPLHALLALLQAD